MQILYAQVKQVKEIFRSADVTALSLKKQFLADNDIPSHILYDGTEITEQPSSPRYGAVYHLDHEAVLVVEDELEQSAHDFLDDIEIPEDAGEPVRNRFGQTGEDLQNTRKSAERWIARSLVLCLAAVVVYFLLDILNII